MNRSHHVASFGVLFLGGAAVVAGSLALAQQGKDGQPPEMQLPAGWTAEDMQAMMAAGTPGEMHEYLKKGAGVWTGTNTMRMTPDMPEMVTPTTWNSTSIMDGRYLKTDVSGEIPGMGAFSGMAVIGFDNVTGKFVSTWIDNHGTGIMTGVGELSADQKTMTCTYTHNCPISKKPVQMRETSRHLSDDHMAVEFVCKEPKTGKEFTCMKMDLKRKR